MEIQAHVKIYRSKALCITCLLIVVFFMEIACWLLAEAFDRGTGVEILVTLAILIISMVIVCKVATPNKCTVYIQGLDNMMLITKNYRKFNFNLFRLASMNKLNITAKTWSKEIELEIKDKRYFMITVDRGSYHYFLQTLEDFGFNVKYVNDKEN